MAITVALIVGFAEGSTCSKSVVASASYMDRIADTWQRRSLGSRFIPAADILRSLARWNLFRRHSEKRMSVIAKIAEP